MVASNRNSKTGGRITPQGRSPQAPGVGKTAKRHDLEGTATPGIVDSDLQQGDVNRLEQAQAVAPRAGGKRTQAPASAQPRSGSSAPVGSAGAGLSVPDPLEFASRRLGNTFTGTPGSAPQSVDPTPWIPLLRTLATSPGAGGALTQAFIAEIGNMTNQAQGGLQSEINLNDLDDALGAVLE